MVDVSSSATWSSSAAALTVNSLGVATGSSSGTATLTATTSNKVAGNATVTVVSPRAATSSRSFTVQWLGSAASNGAYLLVGSGGFFARSTDGVHFLDPASTGVTVSLHGATFNGTTCVVVGDGPTLLTSTDLANAFLALKISFINAVSRICEQTGADITRVAKGIGLDCRIGMPFLEAGIGFGGSCFPKDLEAYISISQRLGYDFKLLREVLRINDEQRHRVVEKLENALGGLDKKRIGLLGLSFKPNTDDLRNAPSLAILQALRARGAEVAAYDPRCMEKARHFIELADVSLCSDPYAVATGDGDAEKRRRHVGAIVDILRQRKIVACAANQAH